MMTPETGTLTVIFVRRGGDDDDTYPPKDGRAHRTWPTGILLRAKDVAMLFHNIVHQIYGLLSAVSPKNNDARGACLLASASSLVAVDCRLSMSSVSLDAARS